MSIKCSKSETVMYNSKTNFTWKNDFTSENPITVANIICKKVKKLNIILHHFLFLDYPVFDELEIDDFVTGNLQ